jgi:hypothetical protein
LGLRLFIDGNIKRRIFHEVEILDKKKKGPIEPQQFKTALVRLTFAFAAIIFTAGTYVHG